MDFMELINRNKAVSLKARVAAQDYIHSRQARERTLFYGGKITELTMSEPEYLIFCEKQEALINQIREIEKT